MNTTLYKLLIFQTVSRLSSAALRFVLLLYLLRQTDSAALYGTVTALAAVPMLLGVLFGGVLADRCRKQALLAVLDLTAFIAMAVTAALTGTVSTLPLVLPALCILYAVEGFAQPTTQVCLPLLLNGPALARGNAGLQLITILAEMLGTLLGSALFDRLGLHGVLLPGAALFGIAAAGEYTLTIPHLSKQHTASAKRPPMDAALLPMAAPLALLNLAVVPAFTVGVPVLIVQTLALPDSTLAFTQSAMSAGGLLGSMLAAVSAGRLLLRRGAAPLWYVTAFCALLGLSALPQMPAHYACAAVIVSAFGMMAAAAVFQVLLNTALQARVPADRAGRTMSTVTVAACLTQPAGQALFGLAYEKFAAFPFIVPLAAAVLSVFINIAAGYIFYTESDFTKS